MRLPFILLTLFLGPTAARSVEDTPESVNALLKAGKEVAWVIEDTVNPKDKNLAIVFTARAKNAKPPAFPIIVSGARPAGTDATASDSSDEYIHTLENAIVHLGEKRVLGRVRLRVPDHAYFDGKNRCDLSALWGQDVGDQAVCLLVYRCRWWNLENLFIEAGPDFRQTSIQTHLDSATQKFLSSRAADLKDVPADRFEIYYEPVRPADRFEIYYEPVSLLQPDVRQKTGAVFTVKVGFTAEVPKAADTPIFEGNVTVRLDASPKEVSAKVLKVESAPPQ